MTDAAALCAAVARAIGGEPGLHFRGRLLYRGDRPVPVAAGHLRPDPADDARTVRGAADGIGLRLRGSDLGLHRELGPEGGLRRLLFELLEQFRTESLVPDELRGARGNLRERHERWSLGLHQGGMTGSSGGLLLYAVVQICRAQITGEPVVEETEALIEAPRAALAPVLGPMLPGLRRNRCDQRAFAAEASALAAAAAGVIEAAGPVADPEGEAGAEAGEPARFVLLAENSRDPDDADDPDDPGTPDGEGIAARRRGAAGAAGAAGADGADGAGQDRSGYRVFSTAYDRELPARALARPEELRELRLRLDRLGAEQGVQHARLARELRGLLARPSRPDREGGREDGVLDGRLLTRVATAPGDRRLFRAPVREPEVDAVLTFLLDCSGSMRRHREPLAVLVDSFARAAEPAGASCEVLAFSTGAWNGGRARRDWLRAGKPAEPGRLNERLHLVLKDAGTPWRRARPELAALLRQDFYREGLDGEAVDWACSRIRERPERRRIVVVLSDGSPMDGATRQANPEGLLDRHLAEVAERQERDGAVELSAAGVGLDLSPYYRRSRVLDLSRGMGHALFGQVLDLVAGRERRRPAV
jgi:cobaltochelatase CobT